MDWIKPLINVIKDAVIAIIGYMSGKQSEKLKQAESVAKQAQVGKEVREEINTITPAKRDELRDKYTRD